MFFFLESHEEIDFSTDPEVSVQPDVDCVVVGLDRRFTYRKLHKAQLYINDLGAHFIGTNADPLGNFSTKQVAFRTLNPKLVICVAAFFWDNLEEISIMGIHLS